MRGAYQNFLRYDKLIVLFLGLFLWGLGFIALTPPFEGFDETAHLSSMEEIAFTKTIPLYGQSFLEQGIATYEGPRPYSGFEPSFSAETSYAAFFKDPARVENFAFKYKTPREETKTFRPSAVLNWQAQHPPLYYELMAPLVQATATLSLIDQTLVLRLISYALALGGFFLGVIAFRGTSLWATALKGACFYPLIFPMFFPEYARLGNDSLCALLGGLALSIFARYSRDETKERYLPLLGLLLGLGLLTKVFFMPILAGLFLFMIAPSLQQRLKNFHPASALKTGAMIFGLALLIGGGWYVYKFVTFGTFSGSIDSIAVEKNGGLWSGLLKNFTLYQFVRGLAVTIATTTWVGSLSLVRMPSLLQAPAVAIGLLWCGAYIAKLRHTPQGNLLWLPAYLYGVMGLCLFYHIFLSLAEVGNGSTPGWYLHVLAPFGLLAMGAGGEHLARLRFGKGLVGLSLAYMALFQFLALGAQFALYTGCATKGPDKGFAFDGHAFCLDQTATLIHRFTVYGYPMLALTGFGGGLLCAAFLWLRRKATDWKQNAKE